MAKFSASMMCADFSCLKEEVIKLDNAGIDAFHIDLMDGEFVDNFGMGYQDIECIRALTKKEIDVHLMVCKPIYYLPILLELGVNTVYIHPESEYDPASVIEKLHLHGVNAGIAINPGTSVSLINELLNTTDRVLVLGVNPGHKGRLYQSYVDNKVKQLLELKNTHPFELWLDGAVTKERIRKWDLLGVEGYILGTACLFRKDKIEYAKVLKELRQH